MPKKEHWNLYNQYRDLDIAVITMTLLLEEVRKAKENKPIMIDSSITCKAVLNHPDVKSRSRSELPVEYPLPRVLGMQLYDIIENDKGWEVRNLGDSNGYLYIRTK